MIFINFKTYKEGSGEKALGLVKIIEDVATTAQIKIIPVVQVIDLKKIIENTKLEVWVQNIDPVGYGAHTGSVPPEEIVSVGAKGTFLNHSENKINNFQSLELTLNKAKEVGLKTMVFCQNLEELKKNTILKPDFLAYEPPELIGGMSSVATVQPATIAQAAVLAKEAGIPLLVGAGINSQEDVRTSLSLGAVGVAVATDVVKAVNPRAELTDLTEGFK